jgi:hypothetical protein
VVRIEITAREAVQFLENIQEVIDRPPPEWLYLMNPGRDGLPISFDHEWYPFLGKGYGFNPEAKRRYLPDGIAIIERIKPIIETDWRLSGERIRGGRYFFANNGVVRIPESLNRRQIVAWVWPEDLQFS